jgi:hypothetical protein
VLSPCGHCGEPCAPGAWKEFERVGQIASERVREFVTSWPDSAVIDVRRCRCGHVIARKSRAPMMKACDRLPSS